MEEKPTPPQTPPEQLTVLDYFKALIAPWRGSLPVVPPLQEEDVPTVEPTAMAASPVADAALDRQDSARPALDVAALPWRTGLTILFVLAGQRALMPPGRNWSIGLIMFVIGIGFGLYAWWNGELTLNAPQPILHKADTLLAKSVPLLVGAALSLFAFILFGGNRFNDLGVILWVAGLWLVIAALWQREGQQPGFVKTKRWLDLIRQGEWHLRITRGMIWVALAFGISVFFRFYQLGAVVPEMVSDHAEKLLDVADILGGEYQIYFPRNTGREGLQMYMIAAVAKIFGTGISFMSMKIGTALAGVLTLPYVYLLGKEVGGRRVGLLAMFLMGVAIWPNALARVALRFILYPAFVAPVLYYLLRGLRRNSRNDFILGGLFLGVGLHGYTPFRIVPLLVVVAVVLYAAHHWQAKEQRRQMVVWVLLLAFISLIVFLPLLRYWLEEPDIFAFRAFSRLGGAERDLPGPIWQIFLQNVWNALKMINWDSGQIWVTMLTHYPAVDIVSGAFFILGAVLLLVRYVRRRHWQDLFLLLAIPILMLPSILSLAFPDENPAPNRASGAMIVVFLIAALAIDAVIRAVRLRFDARRGRVFSIGLGLFLLAWVAMLNFDLTFNKYRAQYTAGAWNTAEMGAVIAEFANTVGDPDSAWVVAFPHWVDNRLVGINAGFPEKNYAIWPAELVNTLSLPGPKLFLFKTEDQEAIATLLALYPNGEASLYRSEQPNKDFMLYFVPSGAVDLAPDVTE